MPENKTLTERSAEQSALRLLKIEHQALVRWLHDDLAQNLVAIKSFAGAIAEQNEDCQDDTAEIADIIKQAADDAYRAAYDLMQELRAQDAADQTTTLALTTCLQEARLSEKNILHSLHIDAGLEDLGYFSKAIILRSLRALINFSKQSTEQPQISIGLHALSQSVKHSLELSYSHQGEFKITPNDSAAIRALRERLEAIDGEVQMDTNNQDRLSLILRFHPITLSMESSL